jgi:hypothetical protein
MLELKREVVWIAGKEEVVEVATVGATRFVVEGKALRIARAEHEWDVDIEDPAAIVAAFRTSRRRLDLLTFAQRLPDTQPRFDYHREWGNVAAIPISTFKDWWLQPIVKETRNKVRKAQKLGVEIALVDLDDDLVRGIMAIYDESPIRQGKPFPDYGKDPETIKRKLASFIDRSDFIGAYYKGELIGFVKLVSAGRFTRTMHIVSSLRHRDKAPTNALIARAVQLCVDRGIPYLVYGQFDYGKRGGKGLVEFKRYTGFQKIELPRYYVPLSSFGRLALRLNLHHGVVELLPRDLIDRLWDLRARGYRFRYSRHVPRADMDAAGH